MQLKAVKTNMMTHSRGIVFVVSGPSGCGKSTVLHEVFKKRDNLYFSVSATTRLPRPGECDGKDYFFMSREQFQAMCNNGQLLEHAEYAGNFYGTPRGPVEEKLLSGFDVIMDIDVQGARQVKEKMPEAVLIFVAPPSMEELEVRLRGRSTESEEKVLRRLEAAKVELNMSTMYDKIIINDEVSKAADELLDIMDNSHRLNDQL